MVPATDTAQKNISHCVANRSAISSFKRLGPGSGEMCFEAISFYETLITKLMQKRVMRKWSDQNPHKAGLDLVIRFGLTFIDSKHVNTGGTKQKRR